MHEEYDYIEAEMEDEDDLCPHGYGYDEWCDICDEDHDDELFYNGK